jgi:energy-coupling factor transporter ATP-binding protein EcfA2
MSTIYRVNTSNQPSQEIILEKSTILLGVNGSGKSVNLKYMAFRLSHDMGVKNLLYVEGGRSISLADNVGIRHSGQDISLDQVEKEYETNRSGRFIQRINSAFELLIRRGERIVREHSKAIHQWSVRKEGHPPNRPELPLEKLFSLFSEIFTSLRLEYDDDTRKFSCSKNDSNKYSISMLSDGEKQVLLHLAEIGVLKEPGGAVIVDEPELNLNGSLAARLWSLLEDECEDTLFAYATHDIGFCMRENVRRIYVMDESTSSIKELMGIADMTETQLRSFLGMIPAILSSTKVLLTEGKPDSFDAIFYRWITGEKALQIVPMGGCEDVKAIADRRQFWSQIAYTVSISGVIDRDFKPGSQLKAKNTANTIVLDLHEAESYICVPSVVVAIARALGLVSERNIESNVEDGIVEHFKENFLTILSHRVRYKANFDMGELAVAKSILRSLANPGELKAEFLAEAGRQKQYANDNLSRSRIEAIFDEEREFLDSIIQRRDLSEMLVVGPGKSLLQKLSKLVGAQAPLDYLRACTKHLDVSAYEHLRHLKARLNQQQDKEGLI